MRIFEALFKGESTLFGLRSVEKCFENPFGKVGPVFHNLRWSIKLSKHFSRASVLDGIQKVERCVPWKSVLKCLFGRPKSSFGEHKLESQDVDVSVELTS